MNLQNYFLYIVADLWQIHSDFLQRESHALCIKVALFFNPDVFYVFLASLF